MGMFDMRCGLSGLSTSWPGTAGPAKEVAIDKLQVRDLVDLKFASDVVCSMFFAEERNGKVVPVTMPVTGLYNYYGALVADRTAQAEKVFAADDDRIACLYREDVAEAIAGPLVDGRFERLKAWANDHGGFSVWDSGSQFTNADIKAHTERAWRLGDPGLRRLIRTTRPKWAAKWSTADDALDELRRQLASVPAKTYRASEGFDVADVIEHPTFGRGTVEALVVPNKISVNFVGSTKVLVHKPR